MYRQQKILFNARKQIRNKLRRQEIQSYFQVRRAEALKQVEHHQEQEPNHLDSQESKINFLIQLHQELSSTLQTTSHWNSIIQSLQDSIPNYQHNFDLLIKHKIIDILCSSMKTKYSHLNFQHQIVRIFAKTIIYYRNQSNFTYISHFFQANYIQDCIIYQKSLPLAHYQSIQFIHFYSNLCGISDVTRKNLLQLGVGDILVNMGYSILKTPYAESEELIYNYLGYTSEFLRIFMDKDKYRFPDLSFVLQVIPILSHFIELMLSEKIINQCLFCFILMLKQKRPRIFQAILQTNSIITRIFSFLRYKPYQVKALNFISCLSYSENHNISKFITQLNLLDILFDINSQQGTRNQIKILTSNILNNLIDNERLATILVSHLIWKTICSNFVHHNVSVKQEVLYCILNAISCIQNMQVKRLVFVTNNLIHLAMDQLLERRATNHHISYLILQLLQRYIIAYTQENSQENRAVCILESIYRFTNLLERIINDQISQQLVDKASKLYDFINTTFVLSQF